MGRARTVKAKESKLEAKALESSSESVQPGTGLNFVNHRDYNE